MVSAHLDEDKLTRELQAEVGSDPVLLPVLLPAGEGGGATPYCNHTESMMKWKHFCPFS